MNVGLLLVGLGKVVFGIVVGAIGIFAASRALDRFLGRKNTEGDMKEGNVASGALKAGSLVALGILLQHAVTATFAAMDLLYRGESVDGEAVARFAAYAGVHLGVSVVVGALVLAGGTLLFARLTRGVDELGEVRRGNLAPALVLAAVMVVLALMTAPGLRTALDGLLPLPELGRDEVIVPS